MLCCCRYDKQIRLLQREVKDAEEEAVMCGTATIAGGYGQMVPNPKHISSSEDRKLALKHYKNKQDMLKVRNLATVWSCYTTHERPQMYGTFPYMQQITTIAQLF